MSHDHSTPMPLHPVGVNSLIQCNVHGHLPSLYYDVGGFYTQLSEMMKEKIKPFKTEVLKNIFMKFIVTKTLHRWRLLIIF